VILGAGLDTRGCRLAEPAGVRTVEVDLPANVATKRHRLRAVFGGVPPHTTLILVDLATERLDEAFAAYDVA